MYSETTKDITYSCILRHKDHPFFKQFYHGPNGIQIGSERYKEIEAMEKRIWNTPIHELLDITIEETNLDGRHDTQNSYPYIIRTYWRNSPINHL